MQLELHKFYRCRNGDAVKITRIDAYENKAWGEIGTGMSAMTACYYLSSGRIVPGQDSSYDIIEPAEPELYFRLKVEFGREVTVSESQLTRHANRLYQEAGACIPTEGTAKRILAAAALRMIELAKIKPPSHPLPKHTIEEIERMCQAGTSTKSAADQAARELATMLKTDLGVDVTPILLRLWLVERWDQVAKLAHKIHGA